jgi:hypothetical protein
MARFRVTISSDNRDAMLDLVRQYRIAIIDHGLRSGGGRAYSADALVNESQIPMLESKGYFIEQHEDVDRAGRERQQEVGRGNRYTQAGTLQQN